MLKSLSEISIEKDRAVLAMKKMNKAATVIVFDLGGVLMDWNPYHLYCDKLGLDREVVDRFMEDVDFAGWNKEQDRGRSFAEATKVLSARFPQYRDLIYAYDKFYLDSLGGSIQPVVDILQKLKNVEYPLYILSNWPAEKFELVRPLYPFIEWFDGIVISGEVGSIKPERVIFKILLERTGHPANECLFIDDHIPNIRVAEGLGFQTILFQSAEQLEAELRKRGILDDRREPRVE
jgi:2-haloacid dehalogenase